MKRIHISLVRFIAMIVLLTMTPLPGLTNPSVHAATTVVTPGYEATIEAAREAVESQLSTGIPSSATLAIMVEGEVVFAKGFGLRDRAKNLPVELDTQFNIGSISKIFSAASILLLEQEGRISLDKPVTNYIPNFTMKDLRYKDITVRMLINHTSGLPGTNMKDGFTTVKNRNYIKETLERLKDNVLVNDPGKVSIYCNDGFTLAEAVVEYVSGMSYPDFLQEKVFDKLGLENTSAYFKDGNDNIARAYQGDTMLPLPLEYVNLLGSGGIASTAIDLCKYGEILQPGGILNPAMIEEYTKAQYGPETVLEGEPIFNVGLGWDYVEVHKFKTQGINVLAKNGGTLQYTSQLYVLPKERINIAVIFAGHGNPAAIADSVLQTLLEEKGMVKKPTPDTPPQDAKVPDSFKSYEGLYTTGTEIMKVEVSSDKKGIELSVFNGESYEPYDVLSYKENGRFYRSDGINYSFSKDTKGAVMAVHFDNSEAGFVTSEKLNSKKAIDNRLFDGRVWVINNISPNDLYVPILKTEAFPELPGYILLNSGTYTPVALESPRDTAVAFHYLRDQSEIHLQDMEGETFLYNDGYYYSDASKLPMVSVGDSLSIDSDGENKAGKMESGALVSFSIPDGGRTVVFSPELDLVYDSLIWSTREVYAEKGAYILAIGKSGDTFKIQNTELFTDINGHWAKDSINQLASAGILKGTGNRLYQPDYNMMGMDFLSLLERATGIKAEDLSVSGSDIIPFKAGETITRGQAISILADVMGLIGVEGNISPDEEMALITGFSDLEGIDAELKSEVALLIKLGIFSGKGNRIMALNDTLSRGEGAATVLKVIRSLE